MDTINELLLHPGSPVLYRGQPYQIYQMAGNLKTVVLEDPISGRRFSAPIALLSSPASGMETPVEPTVSLELVSDEDWAVARKRLAVIQPLLDDRGYKQLVQTVAQQHGIGTATVYRWLNLFRTTDQLSSLIPGRRGAEQGQSRLSAEVEALVRASLDEVYLNKQRYPLKRVYIDVVARCKRHKVAAPHINTVRKRIKAIREEKALRLRHSSKAADDKYNPHQGKFPGADFPLAVVQIDHTPGDIILVDDQTRMPLGKPWITMAIDVYSRMVVGLYISFENPGALGTGMCVANSLLPKDDWLNQLGVLGDWPCWGKMKKIYVDNAKEFRGNMLKRACEEYGIDLEWRPVRTPHYGGHIERLLGTFAKEIHALPGTTFSNSKERGEYPSAEKSALTLGEFEKWLLHLIVNIYHKSVHKALNASPLEVFTDGIYQKSGLPARFQDVQKVKLDFLPYFERTIQEYGVVLDHIHYYSDVLRPWIHTLEGESLKSRRKRKFIFKRDPRDISILFFYDPDAKTYFPIPYRDLSRPPITLWEHQRVLNELVKNGVKEINEAELFNAYQTRQLIEEQAIAETKRVRRDRQLAKTKSNREKSLRKELAIKIAENGPLLSEESRVLQRPIQLTGSIQPFDLDYGALK
jgi:putative transposase